MAKKIILIHGRDFKPQKDFLEKSWISAIKHGLTRDFSDELANTFSEANPELAYFGEISNKYLKSLEKDYSETNDKADRKKCLAVLQKLQASDFNEESYNALPGKTSLYELLADSFAGTLSFFNIGDNVIGSVAPDMLEYWNRDTQFGSDVRWEITKVLKEALRNDDEIMIIAHSLGSIVAYDVLWKFSYYGEYKQLRDLKAKHQNKGIHTFLTIGSPLGDESAKKRLKGASLNAPRKYPNFIGNWHSVKAEDDYIAHDNDLADDYEDMTPNMNGSINDHKIYNMAVRKTKSNPHHGVGYLIEPTVSKIVYDFLTA